MTKSVFASVSFLSVMQGGCALKTSLDEELRDYDEAPFVSDASVSDAAISQTDSGSPAVADAGTPRCTGADPIALFLCQLTAGSASQPQQATTPSLNDLLGSLGGLANIAEVLGPLLGTNGGRGTMQQADLVGLVNGAGGLENVAQLLSQLLGGNTAVASGFAPGGTTRTQPASLADFIASLGIPVAGTPTMMTQAPTASDCANATSPVQQFVCALQAAQ